MTHSRSFETDFQVAWAEGRSIEDTLEQAVVYALEEY